MANIQELWTDGISVVGVVRRVYYHALFVFRDGHKEWHYFGTDPVEKPPTSEDEIFEHTYVQIPNEMDNIPQNEADEIFYDLGVLVGRNRESID